MALHGNEMANSKKLNWCENFCAVLSISVGLLVSTEQKSPFQYRPPQ